MGTALITGASCGMGAAYADRLARRGYSLILVARDHDKLNSVARKVRSETGQTVRTLAADLTEPYDLACVEEHLRSDPAIVMLVNNAAVGSGLPLLNTNANEMEAMIALNVTALMRLTYAAAPQFVRRGSGTIINISSQVAIAPGVHNGVYGGTKAFVLAFSESLQREFKNKGLCIQVVLPGRTKTDIYSHAGISMEEMADRSAGRTMSAEDMVDSALAGLDQGEFVTLPSLSEADAWKEYEIARDRILPTLESATPAERYR